jgi:hypothetical protein
VALGEALLRQKAGQAYRVCNRNVCDQGHTAFLLDCGESLRFPESVAPSIECANLPAHTTALPEGVAKVGEVPSGGRQGRNDFRKIGYGGPARLPARSIATSSNSMLWTKSSTSSRAPASRTPSRPCKVPCAFNRPHVQRGRQNGHTPDEQRTHH